MEHQSIHKFAPAQEPGEDAIREYAYHLYQQGNYAPGHDVANWLEATNFPGCDLKLPPPSPRLKQLREQQRQHSAPKTAPGQ